MMRILALFFTLTLTTIFVLSASNYQNTLMALQFNKQSDGSLSLAVKMKDDYTGTITPVKKDACTYVIMLPDIDSQAATPNLSNLSGLVSSVNIRTMPYSSGGKGYTRITVKLSSPSNLTISQDAYEQSGAYENRVYDRDSNYEPVYEEQEYTSDTSESVEKKVKTKKGKQSNKKVKSSDKTSELSNEEVYEEESISDEDIFGNNNDSTGQSVPVNNSSNEGFLLIMGVTLLIICSVYFYVKTKNRLTEIAGEKINIETDDAVEKKKDKDKPIKKIKSEINKLDSKYNRSAVRPTISEYTASMPPVIRKEKTKENLNIVDLDELFNQKVKSQEEENIALEEFLSGFSYMDSSNQSTDQTTTPEPALDEELYNNVIEDNELKFNKDDIERINKILQSEIGDSTLKNIEKYAVSNPLKPTKKQILEELVTTYTISQNIRFSKEDVDALYKLINVEIDPDFVKDLSVNRSRTQEMAKQIESYTSERKKPSEIMTLKVADLLPNLADVMANPEKYKDQEPVRAEVDESTLLKNIQNVTFKPFYDGSEKFEVINTFDEEREENILEINKSETQNIVNRSSDISADSKYVGGRQIPPKKLSSENLQCILDGRSYSVLSSVEFIDKIGCHLAKNDSGYFVLGYSGDEVKIIKNMGSARCERIIARMSEAIDGGGRYIIRAGAQKFLVEVKNNCVEFVMDL